MKLTIHITLVPRWRITGAKPLLPLYAFMVRKTIFPFTLSWIYNYKPSLIAFLVQPCSWTNGKDALNIFFFISSSCFVLSSSWDDEKPPWVVSLLRLRLIRNPHRPIKRVNHVTTDINWNMTLCNKMMEHKLMKQWVWIVYSYSDGKAKRPCIVTSKVCSLKL